MKPKPFVSLNHFTFPVLLIPQPFPVLTHQEQKKRPELPRSLSRSLVFEAGLSFACGRKSTLDRAFRQLQGRLYGASVSAAAAAGPERRPSEGVTRQLTRSRDRAAPAG